jgi:hypothetical protein
MLDVHRAIILWSRDSVCDAGVLSLARRGPVMARREKSRALAVPRCTQRMRADHEVLLYNRALSDAEIKRLAASRL